MSTKEFAKNTAKIKKLNIVKAKHKLQPLQHFVLHMWNNFEHALRLLLNL